MAIILGRSSAYAGILLRSSGFESLSALSTIRCLCLCDPRKWDITPCESKLQHRSLSVYTCSPQFRTQYSLKNIQTISLLYNDEFIRTYSSQTSKDNSKNESDNSVTLQKPNIFQKMKQLMRDYWHILIPVHVATSAVWITIFYIAAKNGVDIISLMEYVHMPEQYIDIIRNSNAGNWAVTYALYKIFTPLRYTVTVGGTTMSIRYLDRMGYLKFKRRSTEVSSTNKSNNITKEKTDKSPEYSEKNRKGKD